RLRAPGNPTSLILMTTRRYLFLLVPLFTPRLALANPGASRTAAQAHAHRAMLDRGFVLAGGSYRPAVTTTGKLARQRQLATSDQELSPANDPQVLQHQAMLRRRYVLAGGKYRPAFGDLREVRQQELADVARIKGRGEDSPLPASLSRDD